jgi:hypothetical protein
MLPIAAKSEPVRDIPYFVHNPAEARATAQVCNSNAAYDRLPTCQNANRALHQIDVNNLAAEYRAGAARGHALLYDPDYWSKNPMARAGVLAQCRRRAPEDQMMLPYCQAASLSALADLQGR